MSCPHDTGVAPRGRPDLFERLGPWLAATLVLAAVGLLAVLAAQALAMQAAEEAERSAAATRDRLAHAAARFAAGLPTRLAAMPYIVFPPVATTPLPLRVPGHREAQVALLAYCLDGDAAHARLLRTRIDAEGDEAWFWELLLARRAWRAGNSVRALASLQALAEAADRAIGPIALPASETEGAGPSLQTVVGVLAARISAERGDLAAAVHWLNHAGRHGPPWHAVSGVRVPASAPAGIQPLWPQPWPEPLRSHLELIDQAWTAAPPLATPVFQRWGALTVAAGHDASGTRLVRAETVCADLQRELTAAVGANWRFTVAASGNASATGPGCESFAEPRLAGLHWQLTPAGVVPPPVAAAQRMRLGLALSLAIAGFAVFVLLEWRRRTQRQANTARETLFRQAAHDLKTPLATLRVLTETLQLGRYRDVDQQQRYWRQMLTEIDHATADVDAMLLAARLDAGTIEPTREVIDPYDVLTHLRQRLAPRLDNWQVRLCLRPQPPLLLAADPVMFERTLVNLLENALEHAAAGRALDLDVRRDGAHHIAIVIEDRGAADVRDGGAAWFAASGHGLKLVEAIVVHHGGRLQIRGRKGGGTTVTTSWPAAPSPSAEEAEE